MDRLSRGKFFELGNAAAAHTAALAREAEKARQDTARVVSEKRR